MISLNDAASRLGTNEKGVLDIAASGRLKAYTRWKGTAHIEFVRWWPDRREYESLDGSWLSDFLPLTMETADDLRYDGKVDVTELAIWNTDAAQRALAVGGDAEYVRQRIIFSPGALKPAAHNRIPSGSDSLSVTQDDVWFKAADIEALQATLAAFSRTPESAKIADFTDIPGKLPNTSAGRLAILAAWQIESKTNRAASRDVVMEMLQKWATDGSHPETLTKAVRDKRAVEWNTSDMKPKIYDIEACGKTLKTWIESRA